MTLTTVLARAALAALTTLALVVPLAAPAHAAGPPAPSVSFSTAPDPFAPFVGQVSCDPTEKPGTRALADMVWNAYRVGSRGYISRPCSSGGASEHKDGRAWDWMLNAHDPVQKATGDAFVAWLTGPDATGVQGGNARRLGVMYVIWNKRVWKGYTKAVGWYDYTGSSPHTDHIHISLSWDGAMKRTSWWTGVAVTKHDYGPCQVYSFRPAPPYSGVNHSPCPAARSQLVSFPRSWDGDAHPDLLGLDAQGDLSMSRGPLTSAATSRIGRNWTEVDLVTTIGDFDGDARQDLTARHPGTGNLILYSGDGKGGFLRSSGIGTSWNGMDLLVGVGDWNGDRTADLIARQQGSSDLYFYPGNGVGRFTGGTPIGRNWQDIESLVAAGDMDGDGAPDMIGRSRSTADLYLYSGDGRGGFKGQRRVGSNWSAFVSLVAPGDVDRDGRGDVIGVLPSGATLLYSGDGRGGWLGSRELPVSGLSGWLVR